MVLEVLVAVVVVAGDRARRLVRRVELIALDMLNGGRRCNRYITERSRYHECSDLGMNEATLLLSTNRMRW